VARRAERNVVKLFGEFPQSKRVLKLLNRISDYLFLLARKSNKLEGVNEKLITSFEP
jgi:cob(I)alamin adenosyltransferase